jgi:hypothetical protein
MREVQDIAAYFNLQNATNIDGGASAGIWRNGSYITRPGRLLPVVTFITGNPGATQEIQPPPVPQVPAPEEENGAAPTFTDIPPNHWALTYITNAAEKGLMQGVGENRFNPEGLLTRAQIAQILFNAYETHLPAGAMSFPDVSDGSWYARAVTWAGYRGIIDTAAGGNFNPNAPATRELRAEALFRVSVQKNVALPTVRDSVTFTDQAQINHLPAVNALQRAGIVSGFPDGSFGPHRTITRAEMAALADRFTDIPGLASGGA